MAQLNSSPFGPLLRKYRLAAGYTQDQLAERAGLSARGISDLERGLNSTPREDTALRLVEALELTDYDRAAFLCAARSGRVAQVRHSIPDQSPVSTRHAPRRLPQLSGTVQAIRSFHRSLRKVALRGLASVVGLVAAVLAVVLAFVLLPRSHGKAADAQGYLVGAAVAGWQRSTPLPGWLSRPESVSVDRAGNVYVADAALDRITVFSPSGAVLRTWGKPGSGPGEFHNPEALTTDVAGNVYVVDTGNNRIQKFASTGSFLAQWGSFGFALGQFINPNGIAVDQQGLIYVTDAGNNRVEVLLSSGRPSTYLAYCTVPSGPLAVDSRGVLYSAVLEAQFGGIDGIEAFSASGDLPVTVVALKDTGEPTPSAAQDPFVRVSAMTLDGHGHMYVADGPAHQIVEMTLTAIVVARWSADGRGGGVRTPSGIAVDRWGNVYVTDGNLGIVEKVSATGKLLLRFGTPLIAMRGTRSPEGVTVGPNGDVYVADTRNDRVLHYSQAGQLIGAWGSHDAGKGQLNRPGSIGSDGAGHVYVLDSNGTRLQEFSPQGRSVRVDGLSAESLYDPTSISVVPRGVVYILEAGSSRILRISQDDVTAWHILAGSAGETRGFAQPISLATDPMSNLDVLDDAYVMHRLSPTGDEIETWSLPVSAEFDVHMAVGADGRIYLLHSATDRVDILSPHGRVLQSFGAMGHSPGQLESPQGIAVDMTGNVYIADTGNNRVQKFAVRR